MGTGQRTGRRPGNPDTRTQILAAAQTLFAEKGFRATTLRSIADAAGVNVALISHYFGGKQQLFDAIQEFPSDVLRSVTDAIAGDSDGMGERITRAYLGVWEDEDLRPRLLALVRSSASEDAGLDRMREVITGALVGDGHRQLSYAMAQLFGIAMLRYVTCVPAVADVPFEQLVADIAPAVQLHINRAGA